MCTSLGVLVVDPSDGHGRMLHEALLHLGERLDQLGAEVRRIDTGRVNERLDCLRTPT